MNWEEEENYGINPLNSTVFSEWSCVAPFKSETYCLMDIGTYIHTHIYMSYLLGKDTQGIDSLYGIL